MGIDIRLGLRTLLLTFGASAFCFSIKAQGLFRGGVGDGVAFINISQPYSRNMQLMFSGGNGDGVSLLNVSQTYNPQIAFIFKGGNGDGTAFLTYTQAHNPNVSSSYKGGIGDGISLLSFSQQAHQALQILFSGGKGDGVAVNDSLSYIPLGSFVFWTGGSNTQFNLSGNWLGNRAPASGSDIAFAENAIRDLVLDNNRSIGKLDFNQSNKKLILGSYSLTLRDSIADADSISYIQTNGSGQLKKHIESGRSFFFPVGNSAYNPVNITNNTASSDTFGARVLDEVYVNGTSGAVFNRDPRIRRSWDISKTSGNSNSGSGVDFVFYWNTGEDTLSPSQLFLSHYDGSSWTQLSGSATVSGNSLSYNGYMGSFSPFAINGNRPLPVSWLYVRGQCEGLQSRIEWATAAEVNNRRFVTEGSRNGNEWFEVRETTGKGYSSNTETYQEIIHSNYPYIRIRQEDFDGTQAYSETIYLPCVQGPAEVAVVPNPSEGVFRILGGEWLKSYVLINAFGQKVSEGETGALPEWRLDLSSLEKGIYSLRMLGEGAEVLRKIVLQ